MVSNIQKRFESFVMPEPNTGCWLWSGSLVTKGYGAFRLNGKSVMAHRVSYKMYNGEIGLMHVLHKCDCPSCVNPDHLFLGTDTDNKIDMENKGRRVRGSLSPMSKLTETDIISIRESKMPGFVIAKKYGVSQSVISRVKSKNSWKHI